MCWHTQFPGIPKRILARGVTLGEEKVEFILMCGLGLLWGCKRLGEGGRLRLFGERVEGGGEGLAVLLGRGTGAELGEGVVRARGHGLKGFRLRLLLRIGVIGHT